MQAKLPDRGQHRLRLGERERDALIFRDRSAERLPLLRVGPGLVERGLRGADHLQSDQSAAEIEALHHLDEARAFRRQSILHRHDDIVEEYRAAADRVAAEIAVALRRDAGCIHRHQECADAARAILRFTGAGEQHARVGLISHADRRFFAFQDVAIAVAPGRQHEVGRIRSAAWFGEADANDRLPGDDPVDPMFGEIGVGVLGDDLAVERP